MKDTFLDLVAQGFSVYYADVLYAQALHESGHFTSNIYQNTNNCFGMKQPKVRPTTSLGGWTGTNGVKWANYTDVSSSIEDRILWDGYNKIKFPETPEEVKQYMQNVQSKGYAEDPQYISKVLALTGKLSGTSAETSTGGGIISIGNESRGKWGLWVIIGLVALFFFSNQKKVGRVYRRSRKTYKRYNNRYRRVRNTYRLKRRRYSRRNIKRR